MEEEAQPLGGEGLGSPKVLVDRDPAAQPTGLNSPVNVLD